MVIGQGDYDIEAVRIEDSDIASFDEITHEIVPPGGSLTLFPANVVSAVEVSGQELIEAVSTGPFTDKAAGTQAIFIGVDIVAPRGFYYAEPDGSLSYREATFTVEARPIDEAGAPLGSFATLGDETLGGRTTTPQRVSYRYSVAPGRYEVRVTRSNAKETASRGSNEIAWSGLDRKSVV